MDSVAQTKQELTLVSFWLMLIDRGGCREERACWSGGGECCRGRRSVNVVVVVAFFFLSTFFVGFLAMGHVAGGWL